MWYINPAWSASISLLGCLEFGPVTPTFNRFQMPELSWQNTDTGIWRVYKIDTLIFYMWFTYHQSSPPHFNQVHPLNRSRGHLLHFYLRDRERKREKENKRDKHVIYMYKLYSWYICIKKLYSYIYIKKDKIKYPHIISSCLEMKN